MLKWVSKFRSMKESQKLVIGVVLSFILFFVGGGTTSLLSTAALCLLSIVLGCQLQRVLLLEAKGEQQMVDNSPGNGIVQEEHMYEKALTSNDFVPYPVGLVADATAPSLHQTSGIITTGQINAMVRKAYEEGYQEGLQDGVAEAFEAKKDGVE